MKLIFAILFNLLFIVCLIAQDERSKIEATVMDYIESTANGEPDRLRSAFDKDLNLYYVKNDSLKTWDGEEYIAQIKKGVKNNRIGKIISIDFVNDAAMVKVEIDIPARKRKYTDYLILLKYDGRWKIVHKSFTYLSY